MSLSLRCLARTWEITTQFYTKTLYGVASSELIIFKKYCMWLSEPNVNLHYKKLAACLLCFA